MKDLWTLRLAKQVDKLERSSVLDPESQRPSAKAQSSEEVDEETQNVSKSTAEKASNSPVLVETVALCYLGILLMRLPISLGSIYRYSHWTWLLRHLPTK